MKFRHLLPLSLLTLMLFQGCAADDESMPEPDNEPVPAETDAGAPSEGLVPYMSECVASDQCETGLCFEFNNKGPHCTVTCERDLDCASPSPGCNGKGVCKAPDGEGSGGGGGGGGD